MDKIPTFYHFKPFFTTIVEKIEVLNNVNIPNNQLVKNHLCLRT